MLRKRLPQDALSKVHLNKYGSYFKFILLLSGDINLNYGPTTTKTIDMLWELPFLWEPFHNCSFSTERMDYQHDFLHEISNDTWDIFRKRSMHFIHLNINSLLSKIDEIRFIAKLTNTAGIGLGENTSTIHFLSSELEIEEHDLATSDRRQRGEGAACFVKNSISYNQKPNFCINTESNSIETFLTKPVLIGVLYRPPGKYNVENCLKRTFSDTNGIQSQECYLLGDINMSLQPNDKDIFRNNSANTLFRKITSCH